VAPLALESAGTSPSTLRTATAVRDFLMRLCLSRT
jgi:hypothetical protein